MISKACVRALLFLSRLDCAKREAFRRGCSCCHGCPRGALGRVTLDDHDVIWRQLSRHFLSFRFRRGRFALRRDASLYFIGSRNASSLFIWKELFVSLFISTKGCFAFSFIIAGRNASLFFHRRNTHFIEGTLRFFISIALFIEEHFAFFMEGTLHRRDAFISFYEGTL